MGIGGLWVHRIDRCEGGPAGVIAACIATGADRLIVKCRDGRSAYNEKEIGILASMAMAEGIPFFPWAWPYSTEKHGDPGYIDAQATRIAEDARRLGAAGVILNIEAPLGRPPRRSIRLETSPARSPQGADPRATDDDPIGNR